MYPIDSSISDKRFDMQKLCDVYTVTKLGKCLQLRTKTLSTEHACLCTRGVELRGGTQVCSQDEGWNSVQ